MASPLLITLLALQAFHVAFLYFRMQGFPEICLQSTEKLQPIA